MTGLLERVFRLIVARRWWIVAFYAVLLPPSIYFALKVNQDNSLDRLIVQTDPDYEANQAFEKVFGKGTYVLVLAEADHPFAPDVLARFDALERSLAAIPGAQPSSALSVYRRARGGFDGSPAQAEAFRAFANGTDLFRKQGLVGDWYLTIPVGLSPENPERLKALLEAIDAAVDLLVKTPEPFRAVRKIGGPYVDRYLDEDTHRATMRYMPLFALFLLALNLGLYRSARTLAAFILTLGVAVALTVGYVGLTGGVITIVSPLVPMTILITSTATLVYIHSRFVERPAGVAVDDHQIFALSNKFVACTASLFATAAGFAALSVSKIRPIRDMGIWVAVGLAFTWVVVFTLFPALQKILKTPTEHERRTAGAFFGKLIAALPLATYRWRWVLVPGSLLLCAAGAVALFGLPGVLGPMNLETNAIEYVNHNSAIYKDTKRLEEVIAGLSVTEVWLRGEAACLTDPQVLAGLDRFQAALEHEPVVGSIAGPTTILRMMQYVAGRGDALPQDEPSLEKLAADVEQLLPSEPMLQAFIEKGAMSQTHISVISRASDYRAFHALDARIAALWGEAVKRDPALAPMTMTTTGSGPLQAKISYYLVPTLVQSFALTVVIIFGAFLLVFRSGPARLMAMIPSLFAILVMFGVMRITGMTLNVATILIASTVLGTSENDQIHFFYHFLEKRRTGTTEESLQHTLRIAGRAIFYATMINAGGFLAFAFADLPPMRQFGILSALAFTLSMIADFTALPAALWIVFREKPANSGVSQGQPG